MRNITKKPFLLFLPFLILYLILISILPTNDIHIDDQNRYLTYAQNLLHGFYSPPSPDIDLGNGPGYPMFLVPFAAFNLPLISIRLMNGVLYYLSIVFLFKSLEQVVNFKFSLIFSLLWACYYNFYEQMTFILPEVLTASLIPVLIFNILKAFKNGNSRKVKKFIFFSGIAFGYLALTKPIFGYVLMVMLIASGFLWITSRKSLNYKKSLAILSIALILTLPYLIYTYHLTGKIFYWSSFGGNNLYWMSTPYKGEYGSWHPYYSDPAKKVSFPGSEELIQAHHYKAFELFAKTKGVEQDDMLRRLAIENIKAHPLKFLQNCFSNGGRIIFNFPVSYEIQKPGTLLRLPLNGTILVFAIFCLIPTLLRWRKILYPIRFMLFFALLYFGGSLLGSAENRMFAMIVPILFLWIAYILQRSIKINLQFADEDENKKIHQVKKIGIKKKLPF